MANVEHLIQLSISVDEDTIRQQVLDTAVKQTLDGVEELYIKKERVGSYGRYKYEASSKLQDLVDSKVETLIRENRDYILSEVIKAATDKLTRSKAYKEAIKEVTE